MKVRVGYFVLVQEVDGLPAPGGPGMDQLTRRTSLRVTSGGIAVPMANGNVMMLPLPEEIEEEGGGGGGQTSPRRRWSKLRHRHQHHRGGQPKRGLDQPGRKPEQRRRSWEQTRQKVRHDNNEAFWCRGCHLLWDLKFCLGFE